MSVSVVVDVLVGTGFFTAVTETIRWFFNRPKARVDDAKIVQGMAIELLKPLHEELNRANADVAALRDSIREATEWMLAARELLDKNSISYPDFPSNLAKF